MICPKCGRGKLMSMQNPLAVVPGEVERKRCCSECDAVVETTEVVTAYLERRVVRGRPRKTGASA